MTASPGGPSPESVPSPARASNGVARPSSACVLDPALTAALAPLPLPAIVVCLDRSTVAWANGVARGGVGGEDLTDTSVSDLFAADVREQVANVVAELAAGEVESHLATVPATLPGRGERLYETTWVAIGGDAQGTSHALVYLRPVDLVAGSAPGSSELFGARSLGDVQALVTDADGVVSWISPAGLATLDAIGVPRTRLLGVSIFELESPAYRQTARGLYEEVIRTPGSSAATGVYLEGGVEEPGHYVVYVENRLDDPNVKALLWWRQRADQGAPEGSPVSLERRLSVLERTLETIARELHTAGFASRTHLLAGWQHLPGASSLNDRERKVVDLLAQGLRVPTISQRLYVSQSTIRNNLSSIYKKLGVGSQVELLELLVEEQATRPAGASSGGAPAGRLVLDDPEEAAQTDT